MTKPSDFTDQVRTFEITSETYDLPTSNIPESRANWTLEPSQAALLLHDLQSYYLQALAPPVARSVVLNINAIIAWCRRHDVPLFGCRPTIPKVPADRGLMLDFWGAGSRSSEEPAVASEISVTSQEVRWIEKRSYSAFFATDFEVSLARLGRQDLIVTGLYAGIGCVATSLDAFARDIRVFLISDAVADFSRSAHEAGLLFVANTCGTILPTAHLTSA